MEIVINKCYGGFGLSTAVYEELIELGVPHYKTWDDIPNDNKPYIVDCEDRIGDEKYYSNFGDDDKRNHPLLIQAIKSVGLENASGWAAKLKIVEIPDNIQIE